MTTVAYRDGILAADSLATYTTEAGGSRKHTCRKLYRKRITEGRKSFDVVIATIGESSPGSAAYALRRVFNRIRRLHAPH